MIDDALTLTELSERIGEPVEHLQQWRSLGLIGRMDRDEVAREDVERARFIQLLSRRGISIAAIAQADREQAFLRHYLDRMFPGGSAPTYEVSLAEAAEMLGLDIGTLRGLWKASGLSEQGESLDDQDVEALRGFKAALDAGFPEDALLQLVRVYVDTLARVADAETRLFHFYVHDRLKAQEGARPDLFEAVSKLGTRMIPWIEPAILYFHRRGWQRALREDAIMHFRDATGFANDVDVRGQLRVAILFVDLSGFTAMTDAMGDQAAAHVLERFSLLVREAVNYWEGQVIKQIGDAFMLVFPEPRLAVRCALDIERRTLAEPQFPAVRSGIHFGPVLYREGDYLGGNVNIAARLAADAQRHQVRVTEAVRQETGDLPGVEFVPLGKHHIRGVAEELELFEAMPKVEGIPAPRLVDPVCGMELDPKNVTVRLTLEGRERAFCSHECLRRFVAAPERY